MKTNRLLPALMSALLATALTGCSSSGSSYTPDQAANKAQQEKIKKTLEEQEKARQEKAQQGQSSTQAANTTQPQESKTETATTANNVVTDKPSVADNKASEAEKRNWREFFVVGSADGGDAFAPTATSNGKVFYSSGQPAVIYNEKGTNLDNIDIQYDREFFKHYDIDPTKIQQLVVTDKNGKTLGKFQFVNQQYSSYSNFMSELPAYTGVAFDPELSYEPLAFYTAQPSKAEQLDAQKGVASYVGKAIGYLRDSQGELSPQAANTEVKFNVDFDKKTISGRIDNRFDDLGRKSLFWVKDYDEEDNEIFHPEYANRKNLPLILKETAIKVNDEGNVSFGWHKGEDGKYRAERNVAVEFRGELKDIDQYGGVFSGPNLEDVVGQIGGGEERIIFGATKQDK